MSAITDIVQELHDAMRQRDALAASLPELTQQAEHAAVHRQTVSETLERHEGDALIGRVAESVLTTTRAKHDAAVLEDRKATATLRQAQQDVARLEDAIARLIPEVRAVRIAHYRARQADLAVRLRDGLEALRPLNDELHGNYIEADREFPHVTRRGGGSPHPVAAGLTDLSWHELRHNPHAVNGGKLGSFSKRVDEFLNPPAPAPPRVKAKSQATSETREPGNPWHRLPQEAR